VAGPEVRRTDEVVAWVGRERDSGTAPCPFGHQRGITYATDTHAHGRVLHTICRCGSQHTFISIFTTRMPFLAHSFPRFTPLNPPPTPFFHPFPLSFSPKLPVAPLMRFKASTLAFVSLAVLRLLYDYVLQDLHKHFYRNINDLKCFEYISM